MFADGNLDADDDVFDDEDRMASMSPTGKTGGTSPERTGRDEEDRARENERRPTNHSTGNHKNIDIPSRPRRIKTEIIKISISRLVPDVYVYNTRVSRVRAVESPAARGNKIPGFPRGAQKAGAWGIFATSPGGRL